MDVFVVQHSDRSLRCTVCNEWLLLWPNLRPTLLLTSHPPLPPPNNSRGILVPVLLQTSRGNITPPNLVRLDRRKTKGGSIACTTTNTVHHFSRVLINVYVPPGSTTTFILELDQRWFHKPLFTIWYSDLNEDLTHSESPTNYKTGWHIKTIFIMPALRGHPCSKKKKHPTKTRLKLIDLWRQPTNSPPS